VTITCPKWGEIYVVPTQGMSRNFWRESIRAFNFLFYLRGFPFCCVFLISSCSAVMNYE